MENNEIIIRIIQEYCMNKPSAYETRPFGEYPICYKLMGKIFAQLCPQISFYRITLKCKPEQAELYRQLYPGVVMRGHYCPPVQQPYWNTVNLDEFDDMNMLLQMIDEAYTAVVDSFSKKARAQLISLSELEFKTADKEDPEFKRLCEKLYFTQAYKEGGFSPHSQVAEPDLNDRIQDVILAYHKGEAVACGALHMYNEERALLKYIFTEPAYKSIGLAVEIVRRLEAKAQIRGYDWCMIKQNMALNISAESQNEEYASYKRAGYKPPADCLLYEEEADTIYLERKI